MNKKAFTLVELLAVIVILAIIALIAVPIVLNQIEIAKKKALENSAYGIIEAGRYLYMEDFLTEVGNNNTRYDFEIVNQKFVNIKNANQVLAFNGKMPKNGTLQINSDGKTAIAICDDKYCACKGITDTKVIVQETDCVIDKDTGEITSKVKDGTPAGMIMSYMGNKAPEGYLPCDGAIYNISDYPILAEQIKEEFGSYNYHGGDGTTTFAVPDLRGEFLRGTGSSARNVGSGENVGIHQDPTYLPFFYTNANKDSISPTGGSAWNVDKTLNNWTYGSYIYATDKNNYPIPYGAYSIRPTNTSILYCIKY